MEVLIFGGSCGAQAHKYQPRIAFATFGDSRLHAAAVNDEDGLLEREREGEREKTGVRQRKQSECE